MVSFGVASHCIVSDVGTFVYLCAMSNIKTQPMTQPFHLKSGKTYGRARRILMSAAIMNHTIRTSAPFRGAEPFDMMNHKDYKPSFKTFK